MPEEVKRYPLPGGEIVIGEKYLKINVECFTETSVNNCIGALVEAMFGGN